jgi:hypothetical protein
MTAMPQTVTPLLSAWSDGDKAASAQLMPMVYDVLREESAQHG